MRVRFGRLYCRFDLDIFHLLTSVYICKYQQLNDPDSQMRRLLRRIAPIVITSIRVYHFNLRRLRGLEIIKTAHVDRNEFAAKLRNAISVE